MSDTGPEKRRLFTARTAQNLAEKIIFKLSDVTRRIEVAGSLRRLCVEVHDIDLVCIPETGPSGLDLFGKEQVNFVVERVKSWERQGRIIIEKSGEKVIRFATIGLKIPVDIYLADAEAWAYTLLIRTGSKQHNIRLCTIAAQKGMKLHADGQGLETTIAGEPRFLQPKSEEDIFKALGIDYVPPEGRN